MGSKISERKQTAAHSLTQDIIALEKELDQLQSRLPIGQHRRRFIACLKKFREHMNQHFAVEEKSGFMPEISRTAPEHQNELQRLHDEHRCICEYLESIIGELETLKPGEHVQQRTLHTQIIQMLDRIKRHEISENELIQQIYYQEYGYPS